MILLLPTLWLPPSIGMAAAASTERRFALLISNNEGFEGTVPLRYVTEDVRKTREVLEHQGGYGRLDVYEVDHATPRYLEAKVRELGYRIHTLEEEGVHVTLFVYYTGHADSQQMELGDSGVPWTALKDWLHAAGAEENLLVIDACGSGGAFTAKGLEQIAGPLPNLSEILDDDSFAIVTSSAADQSSRESRELQGSLFTHFFTHGQWGDADTNTNGVVTLQESFDYASGWVKVWSHEQGMGPQDPQLRDTHSDRVVADLASGGGATLVISGSAPGSYDVFDGRTGALVVPVEVKGSDVTLSLRPGRYLLHRRDAYLAARADVTIASGETHIVHRDDLELGWDEEVLKGRMIHARNEAGLLDISVHALAGVATWTDADVRLGRFPTATVGGTEIRAVWPVGLYWGADLWGGGGAGHIYTPDEDGALTTQEWRTASTRTAGFGVGTGFLTHGPVVRLGAGLHLEAWTLDRRLSDGSWAASDDDPSTAPLTIPAPGVEGIFGIQDGHATVEIILRTHYLPYAIEPGTDHVDNVGTTQALLSLGWRL